MRTLGQVLRSQREKQSISLESLSKKTTIPLDFLQFLEEERFADLPAPPLVRGYLQLIAQTLQLSEETLLALYRRDVLANTKPGSESTPRLNALYWHKNLWRFSPRMVSLSLFLILTLSSLGFATWQWQRLSRPPALTVSAPAPFSTLSSPITVTGSTDSENTVTINTESVSLNPQGEFSRQLALPPGERTLVIQATDSRGRTADVILFVTVEE